MNLLTKTFIVVNFVLAALFMWAAIFLLAQQEKWKYESKIYKKANETLATDRDTVVRICEAKLDYMVYNSESARHRLDSKIYECGILSQQNRAAEAKNKQATDKLSVLDKEKADLARENSSLVSIKSELEKACAELSSQMVTAREDKKAAFSQLAAVNSNLISLEKLYATTLVALKDVTSQKERLEQVISTMDPESLRGMQIPAIKLQNVRVVATTGDFICFNAGSDDKIQPDMILSVTHEGNLVARLKVTRVDKDKSYGEVTSKSGNQEPIQGDRVEALPFPSN